MRNCSWLSLKAVWLWLKNPNCLLWLRLTQNNQSHWSLIINTIAYLISLLDIYITTDMPIPAPTHCQKIPYRSNSKPQCINSPKTTLIRWSNQVCNWIQLSYSQKNVVWWLLYNTNEPVVDSFPHAFVATENYTLERRSEREESKVSNGPHTFKSSI